MDQRGLNPTAGPVGFLQKSRLLGCYIKVGHKFCRNTAKSRDIACVETLSHRVDQRTSGAFALGEIPAQSAVRTQQDES
ncbi:uncharacterized [Tachysurus ichikawai]